MLNRNANPPLHSRVTQAFLSAARAVPDYISWGTGRIYHYARVSWFFARYNWNVAVVLNSAFEHNRLTARRYAAIVKAGPTRASRLYHALETLRVRCLLNAKVEGLLCDNPEHADSIKTAVLHLSDNRLWSDAVCQILVKNPGLATNIANALVTLKKADFYCEKNIKTTIDCLKVNCQFAKALSDLLGYYIPNLSLITFNAIARDPAHCEDTAQGLNFLTRNTILTQTNIDIILAVPAQRRCMVAEALGTLTRSKRLNAGTIYAVSHCKDHPPSVAEEIAKFIRYAGTLPPIVLELLTEVEANAHELGVALLGLHRRSFPIQRYKTELLEYASSERFDGRGVIHLSGVFRSLDDSQLLTDLTIRELFGLNKNIANLSMFFDALPEGWLDDTRLDVIIQCEEYVTANFVYAFRDLPNHLITDDFFNQFLDICNAQDDALVIEDNLINLVFQTLGINPNPVLNHNQSTHRASVHRSVSESAGKLLRRYSDQITGDQLDLVLNDLKQYIEAQENVPNVDIALTALDRLRDPRAAYTDPLSTVSLLQLLALSTVALQDSKTRVGAIEDAIAAITDGLYQAQREYNFDEHGHDRGGDALPACLPGTFNKIVEKLISVITLAHINFITPATAGLKLPIVIALQAKALLLAQANTRTAEEAKGFLNQLKDIRNNGLDPIWNKIEGRVSDIMAEDYACAFSGGESGQNFRDFIAVGEYYAYKVPTDVTETLRASKGFKALEKRPFQ